MKPIDAENRNCEKEKRAGEQDCGRVRHSVLEAFDPLLKPSCNFQTFAGITRCFS